MTVVAQLGERWRVVCDTFQWVLQGLHEDGEWHARAHCRSRAALGRCIELHVGGPVSMSELARVVDLPDRPGMVEPPVAATLTSSPVKPPSRPVVKPAPPPRPPRPQPIVARRGESDDAFPVIARLSVGWRIVAALDGTEWILQRQRGHQSANDWRARAHCRTRHALLNCIRTYVKGDVDPASLAIVDALPGHVDWGAPSRRVSIFIHQRPPKRKPGHTMAAPTYQFANNANTILAAPINTVATALQVAAGTGGAFPTPVANQPFLLTLIDAATQTVSEIVLVTQRVADVLTIVRAQEGTTAKAWLGGDICANLVTAGTVQNMEQIPQAQAAAHNWAQDTGSVNSYVATYSPPITQRTQGMTLRIKIANSNNGPCTLDIGAGPSAWVNPDGSALGAGALISGGWAEFVDNVTNYQLISSSQQAQSSAGAATTGDMKFRTTNESITGWVVANATTIGNPHRTRRSAPTTTRPTCSLGIGTTTRTRSARRSPALALQPRVARMLRPTSQPISKSKSTTSAARAWSASTQWAAHRPHASPVFRSRPEP
ncbi:hypothetical protein ACTGJ9_023695 [Bradyrhizobium sp. RDM12]